MLQSLHVPEELLTGILTPIPKKKKDKCIADNYRGITVTPILCKLLEKAWLMRANPILSASQNKMQKGFTNGSSPSFIHSFIHVYFSIKQQYNKYKYKV